MLIAIWRSTSTSVKACEVNWLPWSVLKTSPEAGLKQRSAGEEMDALVRRYVAEKVSGGPCASRMHQRLSRRIGASQGEDQPTVSGICASRNAMFARLGGVWQVDQS